MTVTPVTSHRIGSRTDYLPRTTGPATPWAQVVATANGPDLEETARQARVTIRRRHPDLPAVTVATLSIADASVLGPDDLADVRRPASYKGMTNYIGRMPLPSGRGREGHGGWFESRNEQHHYRSLSISRPITAMSTQAMRIEWVIDGAVRTHVPDALYTTADGATTLVDVTRRARLEDPRAVAIFRLAHATAKALGWAYELRGELTPQHIRNVSFIYSHRFAPDGLPDDWDRRRRQLPYSLSLAEAADAFGRRGRPCYASALHLVATRRLFMGLETPICIDTTVRTRPLPCRSTPCHLTI